MSQLVKKIRTDQGDLQIDYNALANLPSNPNLLINSDFRNPINQRGQTRYSGFGVYTIDRWQTKNVTVDVIDGGIKLTNSGTSAAWFFQLVEKGLSGAFTASANISAVSGNVKFYCQGFSAVTLKTGINKFTITTSDTAVNQISFELAASASVTIKWVKLEYGSIMTDFAPRSYGEEVMLCERYFQIINLHFRPGVTSNDGLTVTFVADVQLRNVTDNAPIVTLYQTPTILKTTDTSSITTTLTFASATLLNGSLVITFNSSVQLGERNMAWSYNNFKVYVDAEIY